MIKLSSGVLLLLLAIATLGGCASQQTAERSQQTAADSPSSFGVAEQRIYRRALDQLAHGNAAAAQAALAALCKDYPRHTGSWINLAHAHFQLQQLDAAEAALQRAFELDPEIADIHNLLGLLAMERGEVQAAEQHYLTAIQLDDSYAFSHYNLALLYDLFHQDIPKAVAHYQHYLAGVDDPDIRRWLQQLQSSMPQEDAQ